MSARVIPPSLHHINLKTRRLQELIDWYGLVVGAAVTFQGEAGAWLTNDAAKYRIAQLTAPDFVDDPGRETNRVELQVDNFGDWGKSIEWMRTSPVFAANPREVFVDPAKIAMAASAGAGLDEIHARAMAGAFAPDQVEA